MASLNPLNPFKQIKRIKKIIEHGAEAITHEPTGVIKGVVDSAKEDLVHKATQDMWKQILMPEAEKEDSHHGGPVEMHAGEEISFAGHDQNSHGQESNEHAEKNEFADVDPGLNYKREILHYRESIASNENRELQQTVNEIMSELKRLIDSTSIVSAELYAVSVADAPAEIGKYHINFFEWMLLTLQDARMKVEDSGAWLATMSSKKGKRDYWGMFKKHGTSFGMSNERSVATQVG